MTFISMLLQMQRLKADFAFFVPEMFEHNDQLSESRNSFVVENVFLLFPTFMNHCLLLFFFHKPDDAVHAEMKQRSNLRKLKSGLRLTPAGLSGNCRLVAQEPDA